MGGRFTVRVEAFFEAAHNLRTYRGPAEPLHGHSYKVEADLEAQRGALDEDQLAVDFVSAGRKLRDLAARLDYGYLNEIAPFDQISPTAENIASWFYRELSGLVADDKAVVTAITIWEGRFNSVTYRPDES